MSDDQGAAQEVPDPGRPQLGIVLKGYPRVSETFIAQEIYGLQRLGIGIQIISLRPPYDAFQHPIHGKITATVLYLPEELGDDPRRVGRAIARLWGRRGFWRAFGLFLKDLVRDRSRTRVRSFGQGAVLAAEAAGSLEWIYAHFAHTPASVARYGAVMRGLPLSISAHAKDIWTSPDWDLREKLGDARWTVTCTGTGRDRLSEINPGARVELVYHGLDLSRFPTPEQAGSLRDGTAANDPVRIVSVGRAVPKKGLDTILRALALLPAELNWSYAHAGGGAGLAALEALTADLGLENRVSWLGPLDQTAVLDLYRGADIFVMASRKNADGDRDGLPNVLVEAASQGLACVGTDFAAIPEFLDNGENGLLVPPEAPEEMAAAIARMIADPTLRRRLGENAARRVREEYDCRPGIGTIASMLGMGPTLS